MTTTTVALHELGVLVQVFEAEDGEGRRVRTGHHQEGCLLDRCFCVFLDAYPAARRWIDHDAPELGRFDAGGLLWTDRRLPGNVTPTRCLFLASEAKVDSSNNGAMLSGEAAAALVERDLAFAVREVTTSS